MTDRLLDEIEAALAGKDARIAELESLLCQTNVGYAECIATRGDYRARIAELEAAQLAQDKLILDYCSRITELEAENRALRNEYKAVNQELTEMQGKYEAARDAYRGEKE